MDRALARFLVWVGTASALAAYIAPNFVTLLDAAVDDAFGTVLPAVPFAALLTVLFLLRWKDLRDVLLLEKGLASELPTRVIGSGILATLVLLRGFSMLSVYASAIAVIFVFYGAALIINPLSKRLMLPYALIYAIGVGAPALLQWGLGEPLATLSSVLSARVIALGGLHMSWYGNQFEFISKTGDTISATVTPGCSSIVSITTFLGLLALMHIDLKKDLSSTVKLALLGVVTLTVLNAVRIAILVWIGYVEGAGAFWTIHNWIGYALFVGFYLVAIVAYTKQSERRVPGAPPQGIGTWNRGL